jgi:hypothetical protein
MAPKSILLPYIPLQSISSLFPGKWSVAAMEDHKGVVLARKRRKCAVSAWMSKVEAMTARVPIYGCGGGNGAVAVAVVAMAW